MWNYHGPQNRYISFLYSFLLDNSLYFGIYEIIGIISVLSLYKMTFANLGR